MAKEYIERTELIENLNRFAPEHYNALINQLITNQHIEDVEEVRHGEWIKKPFVSDLLRKTVKSEFIYTCSVCGYDSISESNYCRQCGIFRDVFYTFSLVLVGVPNSCLYQGEQRLRKERYIMPEWIDVNERLPERDDYYLCAVRDNFVYPFVVIKYFCNGKFDITDWYKENCGRKVTHWMPLPEPPKEGESNA